MKKQVLPNRLVEFDERKIWKRPDGRHDAGKQFLTNLIYMVDLKKTMQMIVPYYWNPGKTIIDVTAGKRLIWKKFSYNHVSPCGFQHWHIDFNDEEKTVEADYHYRAQEITKIKKHYDILVCDFPFTDLKNGVESFGVKSHKELQAGTKADQKFRRDFYFRNFEPLSKVFPECVKPFNKIADSLIVKMGNSHKNTLLINNVTEAELAFDHRRNPESEFNLIDIIGYRGNYSRRGGKFPFAQTVLSYYMIFKKDVKKR